MFEFFEKNIKWFFIPAGIVLFYGVIVILSICFIPNVSFDKFGQFGDSFGFINTLFSGSAFISLVITIYLQQQDMKDTKEEIKRQNFENTFFKMIDLFNNLVKDLELERPTNTVEISPNGEEIFEYIPYEILKQKLFTGINDYQGKKVILELLKILNCYKNITSKYPDRYKIKDSVYEDFYNEYENVIAHYFNMIYKILGFVDKSNITHEEKSDYIKIFLSQFSKKELKLFFLHIRSEISKETFKPLLEKYKLS